MMKVITGFFVVFLTGLLSATPSAAATRGFALSDFSRIDLQSADQVILTVGKGSSVRADGDRRVLDQLQIEVRGDRLLIRRSQESWGTTADAPGSAIIRISVPALSGVNVMGAGAVTLDRMRGPRFAVAVSGAGSVDAGTVEAEKVTLTLQGAGRIRIKGKCQQATINLAGSGGLDAGDLQCADATMVAAGSGDIAAYASRTANVIANGSASVKVGGAPACTIKQQGSGMVSCERPKPRR